MVSASLLFQRNGRILVSPGDGLDDVLRSIRLCAQLHSIVAGNHIYEISPAVIWGSAARGIRTAELIQRLEQVSAMPIPPVFAKTLSETMARYGALKLVDRDSRPVLIAQNHLVLRDIGMRHDFDDASEVEVDPAEIGMLKLAAVKAGWPVEDRRSDTTDSVTISLDPNVQLRPYQRDAISSFRAGRNGVILLPCGAGKTMVGVAAGTDVGGPVLVLVPSRTVGEQWRSTWTASTNCSTEDIGWAGEQPDDPLVTIATYQAATTGNVSGALSSRSWRIIIYDEVQSLPAEVFRLSATLNAQHKLGLSATLVREDGREAEVFALVGPPLYDASWLDLERDGWIAPARCYEVRVPPAEIESDARRYKMAVVQRLLERHRNEPTLVVGTHVASLQATGRRLGFPVLTGESSMSNRNVVFDSFRRGEITTLGVSRIGSVGIDLPDATILIQISGTFGSRQEEAQRLGRLLRPSAGKTARFYTVVASATREQHFATRRQRFLVNQGYIYDIVDATELERVVSGDQ